MIDVSKKKNSFWETVEEKEEWINFTDNVPVDIVIENPEPEAKETPWGIANVLIVYEFPRDSLIGGIRKLLRVTSTRLLKGLKFASPNQIPASGNGYTIIRRGQGFNTTYNVSYTGKFTLLPGGKREPEEESQSRLGE